MDRKYNVYDTIAMIRPSPSMYLGCYSLIRLRAFLDGCFFMVVTFGIDCEVPPDFRGFDDWVAQKFGWRESTAGWCGIILQECDGDDSAALDCFFELLDEYRR